MDLVIERTFDHPAVKVWEAWTTTEGIMKWWGPKNFTESFDKLAEGLK